MSVGVGHLPAPMKVQGVAHMLEHVLTMGSTKFPKDEDYKGYIKEHGGHHSEETEAGKACYSVEVRGEYLRDVLERVLQCFISPLLRETDLKQEINSLDQEFDTTILMNAVLNVSGAMLRNPNIYLINFFLVWNKSSLLPKGNDDYAHLQKKIKAFHKKRYRVQNLKLVIGQDFTWKPVWIFLLNGRKLPRQLPKKASIWKPRQLYRVIFEMDDHIFEVSWTFMFKEAISKETRRIFVLLYGGTGSLISLLKARGWATSLNGGVWDGGNILHQLHISFFSPYASQTLIWDILSLVYQYLKLLRDSIPKSIFEELKAIGEMEFNFGFEKGEQEYAIQLSG
ncbi:hypothetical protein OROHE_014866 [Orobanche hederae]